MASPTDRDAQETTIATWTIVASFTGLISFFIVSNFARTLFQLNSRSSRWSKAGYLRRFIVAPFRLYRRAFLRKLPKVSSAGHLLLILAYVGLNVALTTYDINWKFPYARFVNRCGWMAILNTCLAFLLAMKNNPLAFLTGYSHERLNVLHRWVGRTILVYALIHVYTYVGIFYKEKILFVILEPEQIHGWVAVVAFKIIFLTSLQFIRKRCYEVFYMVHVTMFILAVVFLGLHKPKIFAPVMYAVGALWCTDRLIRTIRMMMYSHNNTATLIPLSGLATKVVLSQSITSQPGSHAFLAIPKIRNFQTHPFTISSSDGVEFVIKAQKGFTLDLHKYALKYPGAKVRALFDGPYGAVPDFGRYHRVVLFAGGSGATFTVPIAMDLVKNMGRLCTVAIEFIWVIRDERHLTWFESELDTLQKAPNVNVRIYVTTKTDPIVTTRRIEAEAAVEKEVRHSLFVDDDDEIGAADLESRTNHPSSDYTLPPLPLPKFPRGGAWDSRPHSMPEVNLGAFKEIRASTVASKHLIVPQNFQNASARKRNSMLLEAQIDQQPSIHIPTLPGRPDITSIVESVVAAAEERDLIAVAACGPVELMRIARNAVAASIKIGGPSVTLHCEQFGWG